jgi:outer membrane protein assembly factor BamB
MRRRRIWAGVLALLLAGCDWSQIGFNAAHTSFNPYEPALTSSSVQHLTEAWSTEALGYVVANGVIYVAKLDPDHRGITTAVEAHDLEAGSLLWSTPSSAHPVAAGNGLVYVAGVGALDARTGAPRWSLNAFFLALDGARLFVQRGSNPLLIDAIDPNGEPLWALPALIEGTLTGAVVQNGNLVVVSYIGVDNPPYGIVLVSTYSADTGLLLRRVSVPAQASNGRIEPPLASAGGRGWLGAAKDTLYLISGGISDRHGLFAVDPTSGTVRWRTEYPDTFVNGLAVTPSAVVVTASSLPPAPRSDHVITYNRTTGAELWTASVAERVSPPVVAGNLVFVGTDGTDGELVYDADNGRLVTNIPRISGEPIVSDGHVFGERLGPGVQERLVALAPPP